MAGVLRAVFGYCFLLFCVRIVGRRPGRQMTPFEYVIVFFVGGLTLTYMVGDDRSLINAMCQITAVALSHQLLTLIRMRVPTIGRLVDGSPLVLMNKGEWQVDTLRRMGVQDDDVMASARDKGIMQLEQIDYAVLERNGEISVLKKQQD
jgi:uncharacterized membrane protein YcaP (DUF421 family)